MATEDEFKAAVDKSRTLPSQSNDNLLNLYALYKQSTSGDNGGSRLR